MKETEKKLTDVLDTMVEYYKKKIEGNDLSAAEQKNVIQLLRDNKITIDPKSADPLEHLVDGSLDEIDWEQYS